MIYSLISIDNKFFAILSAFWHIFIFGTVLANNAFLLFPTQVPDLKPSLLRMLNLAIIVIEIIPMLMVAVFGIFLAWELERPQFWSAVFMVISLAVSFIVIETGFSFLFILYLDDKHPQLK